MAHPRFCPTCARLGCTTHPQPPATRNARARRDGRTAKHWPATRQRELARAHHQCEHVDAITRQRCTQRHDLTIHLPHGGYHAAEKKYVVYCRHHHGTIDN